MLRMIQSTHASAAKSYYSSSSHDYYCEGQQELAGLWRGTAAEKLGLSGVIQQKDWDAICDGLNPRTGESLLLRRNKERTVGYDLNFHVPKSVSVLYALTEDDRILDSFRESVDATMRDIESEMKTRVRKGGKNEERTTGNAIWGEFIHFTSRPVDGVPDPHLHAHCFLANVTWDDKEQAWKAGQFRDLNRDMPYFEAMFHSRFARKLADLGLPIERTAKGWELGGTPRAVIEKFSRRTAQIEEKARELGIDNPEAKAELGATTRERKAKQLTMPQLQEHWRNRLTSDEFSALSQIGMCLGGDASLANEREAKRGVEYAVEHLFERRSVVPERELLATALRQAVGQATPEQVHRQLDQGGLLVKERNGRRMATTPGVLGEERRIIEFARNGRGTCRPLVKGAHRVSRDWLNASQQNAVRHILQSHDRVILMRGAAGVGKTSLMQETVEAIERSGNKVFAFAPSADASRGVLRGAGFSNADTVATLMVNAKMQGAAKGAVLWIDEAGLLSTKTTAELFALADRIDARVLLTGDRKQHGSVERGAMLRLLEEEAGIKSVEVKEIQRQSGQYKAAIKALSEGKAGEGFARLDDLGWIKEIPDAERYKHLATDYVEAMAHGKTALVVSPTHAEGERITAEIRRLLKERGVLVRDEREFNILENANLTQAERSDALNYLPCDVLQFHQNATGFARGDRLIVNGEPLPLDQAKRFAVFHPTQLKLAAGDEVRITHNGFTADGEHRLDNGSLYRIKNFDRQGNIVLDNGWTVGKNFGHLAHGYAVTSHASQGKTVDCVFVGQSSLSFPASSREQFYVSCSRGRKAVTVYCDDKAALREAVAESDERVTATELVNGSRQREVVALQERYHNQVIERPSIEREERGYER
jgi:conjugative relaxase-like TrwC/TraI family protein